MLAAAVAGFAPRVQEERLLQCTGCCRPPAHCFSRQRRHERAHTVLHEGHLAGSLDGLARHRLSQRKHVRRSNESVRCYLWRAEARRRAGVGVRRR
eukprot:1150493-Rhodomonas_salina.1